MYGTGTGKFMQIVTNDYANSNIELRKKSFTGMK